MPDKACQVSESPKGLFDVDYQLTLADIFRIFELKPKNKSS